MDKAYTYSKSHRIIEIFCISAFLSFSLLVLLEILKSFVVLFSQGEIRISVYLSFAIISAYISADFVSGIVHFLADTFGGVGTPLLGTSFIQPFREHHSDPKGITKHDFIETNGNNCIITLPLVFVFYFTIPAQLSMLSLSLTVYFFTLVLAIFMTNQFHKWAHLDKPNHLVKMLQDFSLILSPLNHDVHHSIPYDKYYCITCGWLNPVLQKIGFFKKLKNLILKTASFFRIKIQVAEDYPM